MFSDPPASRASHIDEDACVDLVSGLMVPDERRAALAHAATCSACEARLRAAAGTHERGRARVARALFSASLPRNTGVPRSRVWLVAAGLVVVTSAAFFATRRSPRDGVTDPPFVPMPVVDEGQWMSDRANMEDDSLVWRGFEAYQRGDHLEAERLLTLARADQGLELMRRAYLASAQLRLGRADAALRTLDPVFQSDLPEPWRSEAEWTRIVANARAGFRERADSLIEARQLDSPPIRERVARLRAGRPLGP